jgi:radical SAM protein with 4Fe4S-binding SPASM domain
VAYYLELTPLCNNRCPGCGNVFTHEANAALDGAGWRALLDRLATHAHRFKITGGEPTLHPAFAAIMDAVETHGVPFTLFTNGRWADPAGTVARLRAMTTCEGLLISLHGSDATTHEAFSGVPGSFAETRANIQRAADAGLDVAVSMVITQHNWDRVPEVLELAMRLGAKYLVCNRLLGVPLATLTPSAAQLHAAITTIDTLRDAGHLIRFGNCIPQCFQPSSSTGCTAGLTFATIDPWGRMRPCNHTDLVVGDLRTQSIAEAWHSEGMARWRALIPEACRQCAAFATCHGGCRAQALLSNRDTDPLMRAPLAHAPASRAEEAIVLYAGLRPARRFVVRDERQGKVLIHGDHVVPVPEACVPVLAGLDGTLSLRQIQRQYGNTALQWVGGLYAQGMVG